LLDISIVFKVLLEDVRQSCYLCHGPTSLAISATYLATISDPVRVSTAKPIKGNSKTRGFLLGTIHIPTLLFGFIVAGTFNTILNSNSGSVPPTTTTKKEVDSIVDPVPNVRGGAQR
jgi:hypothetical protein